MARLKASARQETGTRKVRRLRRKGFIPGIIYGHKEQPLPITISEHDIELAIQHGERVLEVDVDGQRQNVLLKDVQWDTFGQEVIHVDLFRVALDQRVEITVPVVLRGTPAGVAEGGVIQQMVSDIEIECLVTAIPEEIRVPVTHLNVGETMHLRDIELPDGTKLLSDSEAPLCAVSVVAEVEEAVEEEVEAEAAAEPEVIGEKKEEQQPPSEE